MQSIVNLSGQRFRDGWHSLYLLQRRLFEPVERPEEFEQSLASGRPDAGQTIKARYKCSLCPQLPVICHGKSVRFVTNTLQQVQCFTAPRQDHRLGLLWEINLFLLLS